MAKKKAATQRNLPGTRGAIAEIEEAADALIAARADLKALKEELRERLENENPVPEAEEAIRALMHKHKRATYSRKTEDGTKLDVELVTSAERVNCRRSKTKRTQEPGGVA